MTARKVWWCRRHRAELFDERICVAEMALRLSRPTEHESCDIIETRLIPESEVVEVEAQLDPRDSEFDVDMYILTLPEPFGFGPYIIAKTGEVPDDS